MTNLLEFVIEKVMGVDHESLTEVYVAYYLSPHDIELLRGKLRNYVEELSVTNNVLMFERKDGVTKWHIVSVEWFEYRYEFLSPDADPKFFRLCKRK